MNTALVLGGTGQIGAAIALHLAGCGWRAFAASRSGREHLPELATAGIATLDARNRSAADLIAEIGGTVDALVDPLAFDEADARTLLEQKGRYGVLVVLSSTSVYADAEGRTLETARSAGFPDFGGPVAEDQPTVSPGPQTYSTRKAAMERMLQDAPMPVLVLRPGAIHGPHGRHPREWWLIKRGQDGRRATPVAFNAESRFCTTAAASIASLTELWLRAPKTTVLNVADRDAPSVAEIARAIAGQTRLAIPLAPFSGPPGEDHVGSSPWSVPLPFTLECSRAETLGWQRGAYAETVGPACRWIIETAAKQDWREAFPVFTQYGYDPFDYAAEDEFLARRR